MWPRTVMLLWITIFTCTYRQAVADAAQCSADAANTYFAELMIESNVNFNFSITAVTLKDPPVTICWAERVSVCEIVGADTSCNCSRGYTWSNTVCDSQKCCEVQSTCNKNVSDISPLCIPKVKVRLLGSVTPWQSKYLSALTDACRTLNGFESVKVTGRRDGGTIADFEVDLSVIFQTTVLQGQISALENLFNVKIKVASEELVTMQAPNSTVCYESTQSLSCTFNEASENVSWTLTRETETLELVTGSVVEVSSTCGTHKFPSCTKITISNVTGNWAGTYECRFTNGSISHTASTVLDVALLPASINMSLAPLALDCSGGASQEVVITSSIQSSTEKYNVSWTHEGLKTIKNSSRESGEQLIYSLEATVNCEPGSHFAMITFTNRKLDKKEARINIPIVLANSKVCPADGRWPKTPGGDTLIIRECDRGRVGYLERTCLKAGTWLRVLSSCVKEELNIINNVAADFQAGLGASHEVALEIFSGLNNISSDTTNDQADLSISIHILNIMSTASEKIPLDESVVPDFLGAASNMLNTAWNPVNSSVEHNLSSKYLTSMEDLVKNIRMHSSNDYNTANVELKICQNKSSCNRNVFGVGVNLEQSSSSGSVKAMALKNLSEKLKPLNVGETPNIVVSVTLDRRRNSTEHPNISTEHPNINLTLKFPMSRNISTDDKVLCVFWNTISNQWSQDGCSWAPGETKNQSICRCTHLTSFSTLMSLSPVDLPFISEITYAALGVSICSLLIFLVIESLVWSAVVKSNLSHFRHTAMVNIALCLFLADCSFLASISPEKLSEPWCLVLTLSKHYFFLAMFFWMLCLSSMLVHQLIFVFSPLRKRVYMFLSSIVGYVLPTIIVGVTYLYYKYKGLKYCTKGCWLTHEGLLEGSIYAFILPVGVIVLMNMFSMVVVILTLLKSSVPEAIKANDKEMAKSILKAVIFLTPVFGVTWALGFGTMQLNASSGPMAMVVHYAFAILNALQGFFVLLTGCLAEQKVREELLKQLMSGVPKPKGKSESMKHLTTSSKN